MDINFINKSYERYLKVQGTEGADVFEDQVLELLDVHIKEVIIAWLEVFGKNGNLPIYKKLELLYEMDINSLIKHLKENERT